MGCFFALSEGIYAYSHHKKKWQHEDSYKEDNSSIPV
jgi:hypothetical protein